MFNILFLLVLLPPFLWAIVSHLDKYLVSSYSKDNNVGALMIFSSFIGVPIILIAFLINRGLIFNVTPLGVALMILSGIIFVIGIIPSLYAYEQDDASIVTPIWLTSPIFSLIFSYFLLQEVISKYQFLGIFALIAGAMIIGTEFNELKISKIKFKMIGLMLFSAFALSLNVVLFKFNNIETDFVTNIFWTHIGFVLMGLILIAIPSYRKSFYNMISENNVIIWIVNGASEIFTIIGNLLFYYISLWFPISIVQGIMEGIQPLFVLGIGIVGTKLLPKYISENIDKKIVIQKLFGIVFLIIGFLLATVST